MIRILLLVLGLLAVPCAWVVLTDLLYCVSWLNMAKFDWPFTLWLNDYPSRNWSPFEQLRWWGAAVIASGMTGRLCWDARQRLWSTVTALYGESRMRTRREVRRSGLIHTRRPF